MEIPFLCFTVFEVGLVRSYGRANFGATTIFLMFRPQIEVLLRERKTRVATGIRAARMS